MDLDEEGVKSAVPCEGACLRLYCFLHCKQRVTGPGLVPHLVFLLCSKVSGLEFFQPLVDGPGGRS